MALDTKKIQEYNDLLWDIGSPVMIEKMRLAKDLVRGVNVLNITFRNVSQTTLYALSINVSMRDMAGRKLDSTFDYHYYALEVPQCKTFGTETSIIVEPEARNFTITVTRAEFEEMLPFRDTITLKKMPEGSDISALGEFEEEFTNRFKKAKPRTKIQCCPEDKQGYWRCVCRRIYPPYILKCPACRISHDDIFDILKALRAEKAARLKAEALAAKQAAEEAERLRLEEEERIRKEEEERLHKEQERLRLAELERQRLEEEEKIRQEKERIRIEEEQRQKEAFRKKLIRYGGAAAVFVLFLLCIFLFPKKTSIPEDITVAADASAGADQSAAADGSDSIDSDADTAATGDTASETALASAEPVSYGTPIAVIGADLPEEDQHVVLRLIGMKPEDFDQFEVVYVTSAIEHQYLDGTFGSRMLGSRSLSCLLLTPTAPGSGLNISMYNISYCTEDMYREALLASGITDADVVVAGPSRTTGTSALTGCMMLGDRNSDISDSETDDAGSETNTAESEADVMESETDTAESKAEAVSANN